MTEMGWDGDEMSPNVVPVQDPTRRQINFAAP